MRAVQYHRWGGGAAALKHVEVGIPIPKKNEILIKVEAASINPVDWKIQQGVAPHLPSKFPHIPGSDVAGEVIEVGSQVKSVKVGDKVVTFLALKTGGGLAEYAVAKESSTVLIPEGVSAADVAGLPIAGVTPYQALAEIAGVKFDGNDKRLNILVTAASGGVGTYAVQIAKLCNAHVTATCGARNLDFVRSLGADEVIDYKTPEGAALKSPSGVKYDYVLHCATGIPWSTFEPNLVVQGTVIDFTPNFTTFLVSFGKRITCSKKKLVPMFSDPNKERIGFVVNLVKEGKLKTIIDSKYPLSKAEDAWAKSIEGHATGKIIVEP